VGCCWLIQCALDLGDQILFWDCADHRSAASIDDGLRHAAHVELVCQVGKLGGFDTFRADHGGVFHGNLVSEQHGSRAMRSGRCDKDLQVQWFFEMLQEVTYGFAES